MMQDLAALLLMKFGSWVLQEESGGTILKTPMDSQTNLSSEEVIKAKKQIIGCAQKTIGDYCLLAGSPMDANAYYSLALELARLTGIFSGMLGQWRVLYVPCWDNFLVMYMNRERIPKSQETTSKR